MSAQISVHTASFIRPADVTAYASGDLVANSTVAASVRPLSFPVGFKRRGGMIRRVKIRKSGTGVTNAAFRVHIYCPMPLTLSNGDNGAWTTNQSAAYAGSFDVTVGTVFTDGAVGIGISLAGSEVLFNEDMLYVLLEARGAYTPVSGETFSVDLEVVRN
jgi:hypothetical protein